MTTTRKTLKQYFRQYATPTEEQFAALIDSFVHKDEDSLTQSKIDGLVQALREKVTTTEVNTMVESKVSEIVSDPNFAAAPTAHSHAVSDVEGLNTRLTTLETSKTDYEAFKTLVSTFLNAVDASDTTINRWKELEAFLSGITDQDTLAGLLLQLKNEITALIPAPAPTNYLKQIADLDAYTTAQEGEIVQYVGSTTAKYTRGWCYENKGQSGESRVDIQVSSLSYIRKTLNSETDYLFPTVPVPEYLILPKVFKIQDNNQDYYGYCYPENMVIPDAPSRGKTIGGYVLGDTYSSDGERFSFYINNGDVMNNQGRIITSSLSITDLLLDDWFINPSGSIYLYKNIPNTNLRLCTLGWKGNYVDIIRANPLPEQDTLLTEGNLETSSITLNAWEYNIGGWQPIVTSASVS